MILRRFMQHVREQNWFAVGLDVIVVIVGIFLGLQVQAWYEEQEERVQEKVYLERLHVEVLQSLRFTGANFDELLLAEDYQRNYDLMDTILKVFDGTDTMTELGPEHCMAIMASHIYNDQTSFLPTLTELTSSGQLPVIRNEELKIALGNFSLAFDAMHQQANSVRSSSRVLPREHPHLIKLDRKMRNIRLTDEIRHECDYEAMPSDVSFMNDLIDNTARQLVFVSVLATQRETLNTVHKELDRQLGIAH